MDVREFIVKQMPIYYHREDTMKDQSGRGILIRFLGMLGISLQEDLVDKLENLINELDPETATTKFLSLLAFTVGNPVDILGTDESFRLRLSQAISLYKLKGTVKSYKLLFNLLGLEVGVFEDFPPQMYYDTDLKYDSDLLYDNDPCSVLCIPYKLLVAQNGGPVNLTGDMIDALYAAINDIEPINAQLTEIITGARVFTDEFALEFGIPIGMAPFGPEFNNTFRSYHTNN